MLKQIIPLSLRDKLRPWKKPFHAWALRVVKRKAAGKVCSGPFQGIRFNLENPDPPKLLGTYERELHKIIQELAVHEFAQIINVGAGEGYYAAGLAKLFPKAKIFAFEMEIGKHALILALQNANVIGLRMHVLGRCSQPTLANLLESGFSTLVVMDIEGAEVDLLDPGKIPQLRQTWMLVETHDCFKPNVSLILQERFESTHTLRRYKSEIRRRSDFPLPSRAFAFVPDSVFCDLMNEGRPGPQEWFLFEPKHTGLSKS